MLPELISSDGIKVRDTTPEGWSGRSDGSHTFKWSKIKQKRLVLANILRSEMTGLTERVEPLIVPPVDVQLCERSLTLVKVFKVKTKSTTGSLTSWLVRKKERKRRRRLEDSTKRKCWHSSRRIGKQWSSIVGWCEEFKLPKWSKKNASFPAWQLGRYVS